MSDPRPHEPLRERFPLGCRVRFAALARRAAWGDPAMRARVVGYLGTGTDVRIWRDGTRHREVWDAQYLERLEETPHA